MLEFLLSNFVLWTNFVIVLSIAVYMLVTDKRYVLEEFKSQMSFTAVVLFGAFGAFYYYGTDVYQKEIWGSKVNEFVYEEPWSEKATCSYSDCDDDGCVTRYRECIKHHKSKYYILSSTNTQIPISKENFKTAAKEFGNKEFKQSRVNQTTLSSLKGEGDIWKAYPNRVIPSAEKHSYKNYLLGSKSTIQIAHEDSKVEVEPYPDLIEGIYGPIEIDRVVGASLPELEEKLNWSALKYGSSKEINPLIYVTTKPDASFKHELERAWRRGHKNDSILILGVIGDEITWSDSIHWSENERYGVELERSFKGLKLSEVEKIVSKYEEAIEKYWKRLSMEETYGYLKMEIDIPWYYQLLIVLFNLIGNFYIFRLYLKQN
jgi:hypothetical protein